MLAILHARRSQLGKIFSYQRSTDRKISLPPVRGGRTHEESLWRYRHAWPSGSPGRECIATREPSGGRRERRERRWWSWTGSNRRPQACKARALPTELQPLKTRSPGVPIPYRPLCRVALRPSSPPAAASRPVTLTCSGHGRQMVGLGGLEPPTSRLSGGRSNRTELQALRKIAVRDVPWPVPHRGSGSDPGRGTEGRLDTPVSKN